jgi:hypothetical protein
LEQSGQKNKWLKKSKVIKEITQDKQEADIITSSLWNWIGQNSQCNEAAEIQNESGLLLKQNGHEWYIRLN